MMIQFPTAAAQRPAEVQHSNAYNNLIQFFDACETPKECSFYLEAAETCGANGYITETELLTLRRIGRTKRLDLARPEPRTIETNGPGEYFYHPEMGEQEPAAQMRATLSHYGKHYCIDTPLELHGRGITKEPAPHWREGSREAREHWNSYTVTIRAFEKLKEQYSISREILLD